jgi:hypothetical protein
MALFNRLLIVLLAVVVLVGTAAVLLTTLGMIQPGQLASAGRGLSIGWSRSHSSTRRPGA